MNENDFNLLSLHLILIQQKMNENDCNLLSCSEFFHLDHIINNSQLYVKNAN